MSRSRINKQVHARLNNMLAHRGEASYTREEWATLVRPQITLGIEAGDTPKQIARFARMLIMCERVGDDVPVEEVAHDPIEEAAAWMPRV